MTYAKYINSNTIDTNIPNDLIIDGVRWFNVKDNDRLLKLAGYKPLIETPIPVREGYFYSPVYTETETEIIQSWYEEQIIPEVVNRQLSKKKLRDNFKQLGVWSQIKSYIESNEDIEDNWNISVTLDENDPLVQSAIQMLKNNLGMTDEQIENLIEGSISNIQIIGE